MIVLSASLSDSEREVGCGATPHCRHLRIEKAKPIISRVKTNVRTARSRRFGKKEKAYGIKPVKACFTTVLTGFIPYNLERVCKLLNCQPGDILEYVPDQE